MSAYVVAGRPAQHPEPATHLRVSAAPKTAPEVTSDPIDYQRLAIITLGSCVVADEAPAEAGTGSPAAREIK
jgi:hypothetical protein